jgi:hypothetical protein
MTQNSFPVFISFFLLCFGPSIFLLQSFWHISYSQPYFFQLSQQFDLTAPLAHQPNFLWSSSTSRCQLLPSAFLTTAPLFVVSSASDTLEPLHLLPHLPSKNGHTPCLPFHIFISCNRHHWSSTAATSLPLTAYLLPPYGLMKDATRAPPLSIAPTPASISPHRTQNHPPLEHHQLPLLSAVMSPSTQLCLQVVSLVGTLTTSSLSTSPSWTKSRSWSRNP